MTPTRASPKPPHRLTLRLTADGQFTLASHSRLGRRSPAPPTRLGRSAGHSGVGAGEELKEE